MINLQRGSNFSLSEVANHQLPIHVGLGWSDGHHGGQPIELDVNAFLVDETNKVLSDDHFIFFNQLLSPDGAVEYHGNDPKPLQPPAGDKQTFTLNLPNVDPALQKIVFTLTIYEAQARQQNYSQVDAVFIRVVSEQRELARYLLTETFEDETALILGEFYRYKGEWKFRAVGQGFMGGLPALAENFGVVVDEAPPETVTPAADNKKVQLEKRLAQKAPHILDLSKKAQISLEKANLSHHQAKVALCLDISGSMHSLYQSGKIQQLAERILALGCRFDDDGAIDIFLFGSHAHQAGEMGLDNFHNFTQHMLQTYPLEGSTRYGEVMRRIRQVYFPDAQGDKRLQPTSARHPIYVMFVTDGATFDQAETENQLRWSSHEPIFWQFMAIGQSSKDVKKGGMFGWLKGGSDFTFLEKLDDLEGRYLDNADFFSVQDPATIPDHALYDLLMTEYPGWVKQAQEKHLLT